MSVKLLKVFLILTAQHELVFHLWVVKIDARPELRPQRFASEDLVDQGLLALFSSALRPSGDKHVKRHELPDGQKYHEPYATIAHGVIKDAVHVRRPREQTFKPKDDKVAEDASRDEESRPPGVRIRSLEHPDVGVNYNNTIKYG